jgi:calcineurin-like phosphoesterase family protein
MIKYCGRPENFNELIWKGLEGLPKGCTLIHLGDICIGRDVETHDRIKLLPYKKILVKGNHDKKSNSWYLSHGWDFVCNSFSDIILGKNILFSHKPADYSYYDDLNIHGHTHNNDIVDDIEDNKRILYAQEYNNYKPIKIETIINEHIKIIQKRTTGTMRGLL